MTHIRFTVYNSFFKRDIITVTMPHNPFKAIFGTYSKLWKRGRVAMANIEKIDKHFVKMKLEFLMGNGNDVELKLPNGATLTFPDDCDATDFQIIRNHLENMKLSIISNPLQKNKMKQLP